MPGLLGLFNGNYQPGDLQAGIMGPQGQQLQWERQGANTVDQMMGPGTGALMMGSPAVGQMMLGQRNLAATIDALTPQYGRAAATFYALHPEELAKVTTPQKLGIGEHLESPMAPLGLNPAAAAPTSQQQQPPSSQPGPSNASVGGGGYRGPTNTEGMIQQPAMLNLIRQALRGKDVQGQLSAGLSGAGGFNRANFQNLMEKVMPDPRAFGIDEDPVTPEQLVARQAKFPAYEKAQETLGHVSSQMQLAQTEALGILPYLKAAAAKLNPSDFPIWNAAKQEFASQTGNPATAELSSYMNAMINTYSRGISSRGQGPTVSDKNHLAEVLSKYWSAGQWDAGTKAVINELGVANDAIHKNQNRIDVQYGFGKKAAPEDEAAARQAISRGADKQEVIRRFEEGGFNAPKF